LNLSIEPAWCIPDVPPPLSLLSGQIPIRANPEIKTRNHCALTLRRRTARCVTAVEWVYLCTAGSNDRKVITVRPEVNRVTVKQQQR